jgi:hypothetical protein
MNSVEYAYDHAAYVIDNLDKNYDKVIDFVTSIDIAILIAVGYTTQDSIDKLMTEILFELSISEMSVREKKVFIQKKMVK